MRQWEERRCWGCTTPARRLSRSSATSPPPPSTRARHQVSGLTILHWPLLHRKNIFLRDFVFLFIILFVATVNLRHPQPMLGSLHLQVEEAAQGQDPLLLLLQEDPLLQFLVDQEVEHRHHQEDQVQEIFLRHWFLRKFQTLLVSCAYFIFQLTNTTQ